MVRLRKPIEVIDFEFPNWVPIDGDKKNNPDVFALIYSPREFEEAKRRVREDDYIP